MNDTTRFNEIEQQLKNTEYALNVSSIVITTDENGIIESVNDKFCKISKYSRDELLGRNYLSINAVYFNELEEVLRKGNVWHGEIKGIAKDESEYWVDTTIVPFLNENGNPYQYIIILHDITTRKQYETDIESMAFYDTLTQLPNRNHLHRWIAEHEIETNETTTVLFLDLDRFRYINDNFGHQSGDFVLQEIANRLTQCLGETDLIIRQGGDEFIIILKHNHPDETIIDLAKRILQQVSLPIQLLDKQLSIHLSIGISRETGTTDVLDSTSFIESLIKKADTAMLLAKEQGGNDYCISTPEQKIKMDRLFNIELEIKDALKKNEFHIEYQPLINLKNNQIVGVESLLRWSNQALGPISPGEFIPILEKTGDIVTVGKWILWTVCNQMKLWQENGTLLQKISVNVSPIQFKETNFINDLQEILNETQLDASYLELEITEGTILEIKDSAKTLEALQGLGVKVSIDDFGTGYSSLSYLKQLPIDTLKIDKSFIDNLDADGEIIVNTIINMGKNLRFRVIAEGIENKQQLDYLKLQKCHEGQGYYFSKPVKSEVIQKLYHQSSKNWQSID
ncbi:sensor domain-containing protein [Oceanobacillus chungangensis]|uniref:GGDEF domain-containing protein n=1 Tax=Oceanobacillus chungangensis TaxID=1229152 RepID=A0A3D8PWY6_9BACI|nr:EAL domain-containing protein [Oceanobacillus chungangensis]RDW19405.1 GGDEF domain-containing protein [Oceanobacillus chungangensis]